LSRQQFVYVNRPLPTIVAAKISAVMHNPGLRLWPQGERLKAHAWRVRGSKAGLAALGKHLTGAPAGLLIERFTADGVPIPGPAPATSLYHLTAALTDKAVMQLLQLLSQDDAAIAT